MTKKYSVGEFERKVFQITIADLANVINPNSGDEIIEFKDTKITYNMFKNCFFDNGYQHFDLNEQFRNIKELGINNKVIKESSSFKNYIGGTKVNIIDILILKYMQNKKVRLSDISRISLLKDFNTYDSLLDFKIYNNQLGFDDILTLFNLYNNKSIKKYFRFKIKATYYSTILDETISMYFNYLVKIPKSINENNIKEKMPHNESVCDEEESVCDEEESIKTDETLKKSVEVENIVYSNYKKNNENTTIDIKDLTLYDAEENVSDDESDNESESNMTDSSFEVNESDDPFF
jgi:hypothetical protein